MVAVEGFSSVPGFRICDFAIDCQAGAVCPAQEKLVSQFVGAVEVNDLESGIAFEDRALLMMALTGYRAAVRTSDCEGAEDSKCPALVEMNQNPVKRTVIQGLKKIIFGKGQ